MVLRKVYAVVSEEDFQKFRGRCYDEGLTMGEGFAKLVHECAWGRVELKRRRKEQKSHARSRGVSIDELRRKA